MKYIIAFLLFISCRGNTTNTSITESIDYQVQIENFQSDSILTGIQEKIYQAFIQGLMAGDNKLLEKINTDLEALQETNNQNIITYWRSYLQYHSAISSLKYGDKAKAENALDNGIDWLKGLKKKNSEDYALLAMLQGFNMQFKGMKAMLITKNIDKNLKRSVAIDSSNLRAYYVLASNDFYTPAKYGGGKKAEKYLLKAISLAEQNIKNDVLPSWGKVESYEMLIKLYIQKEDWASAKNYFQIANKAYPENYTINQLASKLIGK